MKTEITWHAAFRILRDTFDSFLDNRGLKLSASLSYYTVFSLAPLLLLMISLAGIFFGRDAIQGQVFGEINGLIGNEAATQIQDIIKNMELSGKTTMAVIIGGITLIIGATSVFVDIQESINIIWKVKAKPKRGWLKILSDRLLSSSLIVGLGFLLIVSLVVNGALLALSEWLKGYFPDVTLIVFQIVNIVVSFTVIMTLFGVIFKFLPDAKIAWKDVRAGAFFTACLFMLGRFLIGIYIDYTSTGSAYGAAGSLIVILVWVYYTAAILYFGAEFTRVYAEYMGARIEPADYAVYVEQFEKERDVVILPDTAKPDAEVIVKPEEKPKPKPKPKAKTVAKSADKSTIKTKPKAKKGEEK
ncbi:YihY/virulence factor BrkB family protein [Flavobacterium sp. AS60]|uniref:YihY/virulence factor BrkB family protein n=1 Tax=Flavobacterium anseongense TaxID=2910677 RepID=UPI001F277E5B|nr:YihY/virulence factor BrkB family protein [Flavobacterium sp. AS60]MCF6128567.1 YihY/virulence factor BrkB family protein [Flavobacterium sp. AS60]